GDSMAVLSAMNRIGSAAVDMGASGVKLAMGLGETLDNMAERAAEHQGDLRGPLSMLAVPNEMDFQIPNSQAKLLQDNTLTEEKLSADDGVSPDVIASAGRDGTRAFTNIGTPGGQIQEIAGPNADLIEVVRRRDKAVG